MSSAPPMASSLTTGGGLSAVPDAWLSHVMNRDVRRISGSVVDGQEIDAEAAARCIIGRPGFSYARVSTSDPVTVHLLERCGFHLIDTGVTLEMTSYVPLDLPHTAVREARPEDRAHVEAVARRSFTFSRFHLDPAIPKALADEIKAQWAGNFFLGKRGDHMVIAEHAGGVVGFTQLLNTGDDALVVDLIAVDVNCRGRGVARGMIRYAASMWGLGRPLRVGTQIANTVSLLAYQRMGFRIISSSYVFHHHRTAS